MSEGMFAYVVAYMFSRRNEKNIKKNSDEKVAPARAKQKVLMHSFSCVCVQRTPAPLFKGTVYTV